MTLGAIRIYPVKAFDPAPVSEARITAAGSLAGDRRWALADAGGRFLNGKNEPAVHRIRTAFDLDAGTVIIDGVAAPLAACGPCFSEALGREVTLREDPDAGFPDDTDSPGPTLVSTASLDAVAAWFGFDAEGVRRRFRCNLEIAGTEPFWEDRLYGRRLRIGNVTLEAVNPCQRCVVPSRDPFTGVQDGGFQKRFADLRREHLPPWAVQAPFNHFYRFTVNTRIPASEAGKTLRVGDPVVFE